MFSDKIINGYLMQFMTINTVTDLQDYLFCFKKDEKIIFENNLTSLWCAIPGKIYPNRLIVFIHFMMQH